MNILKKIYQIIYDRSPPSIKVPLSKTVFSLYNKAVVKKTLIPPEKRFPRPFRGCMVVSADFEMAWAWRYAKSGIDPVAMGLRERENVPFLVKLFEQYQFPITWATVGHLFIDRCECVKGKPHPNLRRIPYFEGKWLYNKGDWYDHDPCSTLEQSPAWYGSDLIELIMESKVDHEIGCHSFSHLNCSDKVCPPEVFEDEINECVGLAKKIGIILKSMVFPGGTYGNCAVLKKYGFTNYRFNDDWDMFYPEKDTLGLWCLPSFSNIVADPFEWDLDYWVNRYKHYIDKAIAQNTVIHLWFHPSFDDFVMKELFPKVLKYAGKKRNQGDLWCTTMAGLAQFCEENLLE